MKAMKNMNTRMLGSLGSLKRKPRESGPEESGPSTSTATTTATTHRPVERTLDLGLDTPESNAVRNVQSFCLSGGPQGSGEEVVYLPVIVESVDASPIAAKECAHVIRKYLSKDYYSKPYIQYNAIMLIRILADNPGKTFTRNFDAKFVEVVKQLLRLGRDPSVKQIMIETLDTFQREKAQDPNLTLMNDMWKREFEKISKAYGPPGAPRPMQAPPFGPTATAQQQNYFSRNHNNRRLPDPQELATRIEEARTTATVLTQTVQSTPPSELLSNELVREFVDRCQSASRSIQAYMIAENPAPDNDTMETLIETNELLSKSLTQHQRALLQARKAAGIGGTPSPTPSAGYAPPPPPGPPPSHQNAPAMPARRHSSQHKSKTNRLSATPPPARSPFADPEPPASKTRTHNPPFPKEELPSPPPQSEEQRLDAEPYHPGFSPTRSYAARQDSSVDKVTMHAAVDAEDSEEEKEREESRRVSKVPVFRY